MSFLDQALKNNNVLNIYVWGSRVYGCATPNSDYDYIVILREDYYNELFSTPLCDGNIEEGNNHFNCYTLSVWGEMCKENNIVALECAFLPNEFVLKELEPTKVTIDLVELRKSIGKVASNSYDKCRKKLTIQKDYNPYIAKKSLWHCIRIMLFGIQCAKYGKIVDYSEANQYYNEIVLNPNDNWLDYKLKWHKFCNNMRSEFRKYTEEEWVKWKQNQ